MDQEKHKRLMNKILEAQRRRQMTGLTRQQLSEIFKKPGVQQRQILNQSKIVRTDLRRPIFATPPCRYPVGDSGSGIFISGGIGDVLAVESFMTDEERASLTTIFYGTNKRLPLQSLFTNLPSFPKLKNHITVWDDFSKFWCFFSKEDCIRHMMQNSQTCPESLRMAKDFSILPKFEDIKAGRLKFTGSSFLKHKLTSTHRFELPVQYLVICPFSTDKRLKIRDFVQEDWQQTVDMLRALDAKGVVLNQGHDVVPSYPELINLNNLTSLVEAIEILKGAKGYIGIDSALSVLASQMFYYPHLQIKLNSDHGLSNRQCYFPTQMDPKFLVRSIKMPQEIHSYK